MQKFVRFSSWLTGAGMGLVLHGDLSDDRGCRPTGIFFGNLAKNRFFQCFA